MECRPGQGVSRRWYFDGESPGTRTCRGTPPAAPPCGHGSPPLPGPTRQCKCGSNEQPLRKRPLAQRTTQAPVHADGLSSPSEREARCRPPSESRILQKRSVSSAAAETTVLPSGLCAMCRTRAVWPVSSATLTMLGYFHCAATARDAEGAGECALTSNALP